MIYLHWSQDISLEALKRLVNIIDGEMNRQPHNWPPERIELTNVANEARAMIQKASIGAIKVERRSAPLDEDDLLG